MATSKLTAISAETADELEDVKSVLDFVRISQPIDGVTADAACFAEGQRVALRWAGDRLGMLLDAREQVVQS